MMKATPLWRWANAALEARCLHVMHELPEDVQALIIATVETKNELRSVQDWLASQPKEDGGS